MPAREVGPFPSGPFPSLSHNKPKRGDPKIPGTECSVRAGGWEEEENSCVYYLNLIFTTSSRGTVYQWSAGCCGAPRCSLLT